MKGEKINTTAWSPDGRWITGYLNAVGGERRGHVVVDAQTGEARVLNDDSDGFRVAWLPDARRVLCVQGVGVLEGASRLPTTAPRR
ncbi:hypothetical protein [Gemmatimonas sp.]|uniref:hypothetical protein n=1 Tax=Gemmatimonas sp. TaxID=1962908 RepID=UPI003F6E64E1